MLAASHSPLAESSHQSLADLVTVPRGLSARRVEEMFGLPLGAWRGRRLFALRVSSDRFSSLGIRTGDYLVVEPGAREREGQIVVRRSSTGITLHRVQTPEIDESADSLPLPFPAQGPGRGTRTIGSLIGVARPTPSGSLQPLGQPRSSVSQAPAFSRAPHRRQIQKEEDSAGFLATERIEELRGQLQAWGAWIEQKSQQFSPASRTVEGWRRLETGLRTLIECLEATRNPRLKFALFREANVTVRMIRGEISLQRMSQPERLCA